MRNLYLGSYYYRMNEYCMRARQIGIRIIYESSSTNSSSKDRIYLLSLPRNIFKIVDLYDYSNISSDNHLLDYFDLDSLIKIKECDDLYLKAAVVTRRVFDGIKDKSGNPYIEHLKSVSSGTNNSEDNYIVMVAGLLHDIVEDTDVTCMDLLEVGFTRDIVEVIFLVTKPLIDTSKLTKTEKLELYDREIDSIISSGNNNALRLKINDITNNYDKDRLVKLPLEKQEWFREKYGKQLVKLKNEKERRNI